MWRGEVLRAHIGQSPNRATSKMDGLSFGFPSTRPQPGPLKKRRARSGPWAGCRTIGTANCKRLFCTAENANMQPPSWLGRGARRWEAGWLSRAQEKGKTRSQLVAQMVGCGQHPFRETSCRRVLGALRETRPRPPRIRPPKALRTSPAWDGPSAFSQTAQKLPDHLACFGSSKSNPCLFERCGDCLTGPNGLSHAA